MLFYCNNYSGLLENIFHCNLITIYRTIEAVNHFDLEPYTEIKEWFEKVKGQIPNYEECNGKGAGDMGLWYRTAIGKGK